MGEMGEEGQKVKEKLGVVWLAYSSSLMWFTTQVGQHVRWFMPYSTRQVYWPLAYMSEQYEVATKYSKCLLSFSVFI